MRSRSSESGVFNVAGPEIVSIGEIANLIADELGHDPTFTHGPIQADLVADTQRMRHHLTVPVVPIRDGLRRFLVHRRSHDPRLPGSSQRH